MEILFNKLINYGITPNQFYVLYSLYKGTDPKNMNLHVELRPLKKLKLIDSTTYAITPLGLNIISDIESGVKPTGTKKVSVVLTPDMVTEYLELWPSIKLPSGKPARSDKRNVEGNLKWFMINYSYSWNTILKATAMYVDDYESRGYKFMRTSQYFIKKSDSDRTIQSELANYCQLYETGEVNLGNSFTDKVV